MAMKERSELAAIILAIIPGLGHLYLGCTKRAIVLFIVDMYALYLFVVPFLTGGVLVPDLPFASDWRDRFIVLAIIWIVNMVDVRRELSKDIENGSR